MSPYCWLLLLPSLYRYALCSDSCGEVKYMVSEESGSILLEVDNSGIREISWVFRNTLICIAKPHESMEVKSRHFKNRLYNEANGSLNITKLTKDDQGEFVANLRLKTEQECNQIYNLTVYSKLSEGDIRIYPNITSRETCNVTLTCVVDQKDATISWRGSTTSTVEKTSTIQVEEPYTNSSWTCTASHPVTSISRTVIPLDFCQDENKWEIIILAVFIGLSLLATLALIWYLRKTRNNVCTRMKWNRKHRLNSTNDDTQQTDHVYWEICHTEVCSETEYHEDRKTED